MRYPNLTSSELWHLKAAQGWAELGALSDAFAELDQIGPRNQIHPNVLEVRWHAYHIAKKWSEASDVARIITRIAPARFNGYLMLSFALHAMKQTQQAYENLASVRDKFEAEWMAHYHLACYLAQLGRLDEARASLRRALHINPDQRTTAWHDPDLEPLRCDIKEKLRAFNRDAHDWLSAPRHSRAPL